MRLTMMFNPKGMVQQASEFLSTFWYESVKHLRHYSKMERESTFFLKAHQEESFQRYHLWFKNFEQQLKQLYKKIKRSHSIEILKNINEVFSKISADFSPLYYDVVLKKFSHDFPRYAAVFKHYSQQLENYFKENPEAALDYFYQDIKNHLILMAGNKISKEAFIEQLTLSLYSKIIPQDLYQSVLTLLQNFNPTYCESETVYPFKWIVNGETKNLMAQVEGIFASFEAEDTQDLPEENNQITAQSYAPVAIGTLLITSSLYYLFMQGGGKNNAVSNLYTGMMNFESMVATGVISYLSVIAEHTHSLPIKIAMVSLPLFKFTSAQSSTTNGPYSDTQFIKLLNGGVFDYGCFGWQTADGGYFAVGTTDSFSPSGILLTKWDSNGDLMWARTFGGPSGVAAAAQPTLDGGCVITGYTYIYGKDFSSIFIAKIDANATVNWFKTITGPSFGFGVAVQQTWDGNYVVAGSMFMEDSFYSVLVAKLDSDGTFLWIKAFAGIGNNEGSWIQQTSDRGYIVTGIGGTPVYGFLLAKLDENGTITWGKAIPGGGGATGLCVQQTSDEGFIISGTSDIYYNPERRNVLSIKVDGNGNFLWGNTWNITENNAGNSIGVSVQETVDKGYIVAGATAASTTVGNTTVYYGNVLLTKWYENGTFTWAKTIKLDPEVFLPNEANSVQQLPNEDYLVVGTVNKTLFLARLDSEGNCTSCPPLQSVMPNITPQIFNLMNTTLIESDILSNVTLGSWTVNQTFVNYPTPTQLCPPVSTTGPLTTSFLTTWFSTTNAADSWSFPHSNNLIILEILGSIGGGLFLIAGIVAVYMRRKEIYEKLKKCYEKRALSTDVDPASIPLLRVKPRPTPQPPPLIQLSSARIEMKRNELKKEHELGKGAFGTVYFGIWHRTKENVAIKELKLLPEDTFQVEQFRKEIEVMWALRHPNVVILWGICSREAPYWIVMEHVPNGSLDKALKDPKWNWNAELKIKVAKGIIDGLEHLHNCGIIHRDLKGQNILLDKNKVPKIADFGTSKMDSWIKQTLRNGLNGLYGTPTHMAPEVFDGKAATVESDMYSYGMVLWEIVTQKSPYENHPDVTSKDMNLFRFRALIVEKGIREKIPQKCQPDFEALIKQCWEKDPADRPTAEEAVAKLEAMKTEEKSEEKKVTEEKISNENVLLKDVSQDLDQTKQITDTQEIVASMVNHHGMFIREKARRIDLLLETSQYENNCRI